MRVLKPKVEYNLALQEKLQWSILMYYCKKTINNLTRINWNARLIIASSKINLETEFEHMWLEFPGKNKISKLLIETIDRSELILDTKVARQVWWLIIYCDDVMGRVATSNRPDKHLSRS